MNLNSYFQIDGETEHFINGMWPSYIIFAFYIVMQLYISQCSLCHLLIQNMKHCWTDQSMQTHTPNTRLLACMVSHIATLQVRKILHIPINPCLTGVLFGALYSDCDAPVCIERVFVSHLAWQLIPSVFFIDVSSQGWPKCDRGVGTSISYVCSGSSSKGVYSC